jgi:hypothetical protein
MIENIERVLFTEEQVSARVAEVAAEISEKYRGRELAPGDESRVLHHRPPRPDRPG